MVCSSHLDVCKDHHCSWLLEQWKQDFAVYITICRNHDFSPNIAGGCHAVHLWMPHDFYCPLPLPGAAPALAFALAATARPLPPTPMGTFFICSASWDNDRQDQGLTMHDAETFLSPEHMLQTCISA